MNEIFSWLAKLCRNSKGYDLAKSFNSKFTHLSPVWYDLKRYAQCSDHSSLNCKHKKIANHCFRSGLCSQPPLLPKNSRKASETSNIYI